MTDLSPEQCDLYAPVGTTLRRMLDDEVLPWPTLEQAQTEGFMLDVLDGVIARGVGSTTLPDGSRITLDFREEYDTDKRSIADNPEG